MYPSIAIGLSIAIAIGIAWVLLTRVRVTPKRVPLMTNRIAFPGGLRLHETELAIARLDEPEEIVIPFDKATLVISYPLSTPASVEITAPIATGFTRRELVRSICEEYANVYDAEAGTSMIEPTVEPHEHKRNRTDGAYGIWGYDLQDLVLTAVRWTRRPDGKITIDLHVESWGLRLTT